MKSQADELNEKHFLSNTNYEWKWRQTASQFRCACKSDGRQHQPMECDWFRSDVVIYCRVICVSKIELKFSRRETHKIEERSASAGFAVGNRKEGEREMYLKRASHTEYLDIGSRGVDPNFCTISGWAKLRNRVAQERKVIIIKQTEKGRNRKILFLVFLLNYGLLCVSGPWLNYKI